MSEFSDVELVARLRGENAQLRQANEHLRREVERLRQQIRDGRDDEGVDRGA